MMSGGALALFNQQQFTAGVLDGLAAYTCGINLTWVNFTWSATPGIPIRMSAVEWVK